MKLKAFSLLDTKTGQFNAPFFMSHVGQAIRAIADLGQDKNTIVGRHPADFALMELGTFDDDTGHLVAVNPINHGLVVSFLPPPVPSLPFAPGELDRTVSALSSDELIGAGAQALARGNG